MPYSNWRVLLKPGSLLGGSGTQDKALKAFIVVRRLLSRAAAVVACAGLVCKLRNTLTTPLLNLLRAGWLLDSYLFDWLAPFRWQMLSALAVVSIVAKGAMVKQYDNHGNIHGACRVSSSTSTALYGRRFDHGRYIDM